MWILGHEPAPDHSTIARFQNEKLVPVMEDLFYQLIEQLIGMNEVSYTNVFVDGTKMEANANKYSFVWAKAVEKNLKKLETKTEALTRQTALKYCLREDLSFEELLAEMMQLASFQNLSFVYGKGKRKTQIQRDIDLFSLGDKRHMSKIFSPEKKIVCLKDDISYKPNNCNKPMGKISSAFLHSEFPSLFATHSSCPLLCRCVPADSKSKERCVKSPPCF